jgi:hypothetical protein
MYAQSYQAAPALATKNAARTITLVLVIQRFIGGLHTEGGE